MTKTAIIFGAGSGLGISIARKFGREGYKVALIARRKARLEAIAAELAAEGIDAHPYPLDLGNPDAVAPVVAQIRQELGAIEAVYYGPNAVSEFSPAFGLSIEEVKTSLTLFVTSMVAAVQATLPDLRAAGGGKIIVGLGGSASFAAPFMSGPGPGMAAARHYLTSLHGELAKENIKVTMLILTAVIKNSAWQEKMDSGEIKIDLPPGITIPEIDPEVLAEWLYGATEAGKAEFVYPEMPKA